MQAQIEDAPMSPVSPPAPSSIQATAETPAAPELSKDAILAAIEDVDAEIAHHSNLVAALAAEQAAMTQKYAHMLSILLQTARSN